MELDVGDSGFRSRASALLFFCGWPTLTSSGMEEDENLPIMVQTSQCEFFKTGFHHQSRDRPELHYP